MVHSTIIIIVAWASTISTCLAAILSDGASEKNTLYEAGGKVVELDASTVSKVFDSDKGKQQFLNTNYL